jgi:hypothetical protein
MLGIPTTVLETSEFSKQAEGLLSEEELPELIGYLAEYPEAGVRMRGTGGVRKLRWKRSGTGKRGGVRVIYYYHGPTIPLFLLSLYGKGQKNTLSKAECNQLKKVTAAIVEAYRRNGK